MRKLSISVILPTMDSKREMDEPLSDQAQQMLDLRDRLSRRRCAHRQALAGEARRLASEAAALGVERVILFGSLANGTPGLCSDVDLLVVWDTPLEFLARTAELYRRLQPRVAVDMLVYTPAEMVWMADRPFVRHALAKGEVLYDARCTG